MPDGKLITYLNSAEIEDLNRELGQRITREYKATLSAGEEIIVIVTLKGAMYFAADLTRHLDIPLSVDFVRLASYGGGTKSSGTVRFLKDIEIHPKDKHLLVLDEIVDSGRTLDFLINHLKANEPASIKVCALLSKPSRREIEVQLDYYGKEVEDKFLVGYGLDYNERYRNLKDIFYIEE